MHSIGVGARVLGPASVRPASGSQRQASRGVTVAKRRHASRGAATPGSPAVQADQGPGGEVKPHGPLLGYLSSLEGDQQADVFSKLAAGGFTQPGFEELVTDLNNEQLEKLGIGPQALRSQLLRAFECAGSSKAIVLVDEQGTEEEMEFADRRVFESFASTNPLTFKTKAGRKQCIMFWEQVTDGERYYTSITLEKPVRHVVGFRDSPSGTLEHQVAERALAGMRIKHPEAWRLFCADTGVITNKATNTHREFDDIIVADNCILVLQIKETVDAESMTQLQTAIDFIK